MLATDSKISVSEITSICVASQTASASFSYLRLKPFQLTALAAHPPRLAATPSAALLSASSLASASPTDSYLPLVTLPKLT